MKVFKRLLRFLPETQNIACEFFYPKYVNIFCHLGLLFALTKVNIYSKVVF